MAIITKEIDYKGYGKCIQVSNGIVDLVVTVDVGPRILRYGFVNGKNEFIDDNPSKENVGDSEYIFRGGHRLWHSPERLPRSYIPDNKPVKWANIEGGISVSQEIEPWTQIKKEIDIIVDKSSSKVKIVHRLTNKNAWSVQLSAWAITQAAPGGIEILPQADNDTGLLPNRSVALWPYTKMNDSRIYWGDKYIAVRYDPDIKNPLKIGIQDTHKWAAYINQGNMFIKRFGFNSNTDYPDYGVSYETYCNNLFVEMESLSPVAKLDYDQSVTHIENWELIKNVNIGAIDENNINGIVIKYIEI